MKFFIEIFDILKHISKTLLGSKTPPPDAKHKIQRFNMQHEYMHTKVKIIAVSMINWEQASETLPKNIVHHG
jgi:hypothetical protein